MSDHPFQYAIIRVVPRVERGECLNAGVVLLCRPRRFLAARGGLDRERLAAPPPRVHPAAIQTPPPAVEAVAPRGPGAGPTPRPGPGQPVHPPRAPPPPR